MADNIDEQIVDLRDRPGLFDVLGSPESLLQLNHFLNTPGIAGRPIAQQLAQFAPPKTTHLSARKWTGIAQKLKDFFVSRPIRIEAEEAVWIPIEVHGLYCPAIPGSKASLKVDKGTKEKSSCSVSVFGIGGGHEFTIEFTVGDEFSVEAQNVVVRYLVQGTVAKCVIEAPEGAETFLRLQGIHRKLQRIEVQPVVAPGSELGWGEIVFTREFDLRNAKVTNKFTLESAVESKWRGSPGLKIESLGLELTVEYAASKNWKTVYTYELPAGHLFQARVFANRCFMSALI